MEKTVLTFQIKGKLGKLLILYLLICQRGQHFGMSKNEIEDWYFSPKKKKKMRTSKKGMEGVVLYQNAAFNWSIGMS